jgi:tRNA pseudouridine65 synthase
MEPVLLYRDDALVIVNKPAGAVVHRGWARDGAIVMTMVRDAIGAWVYPIHRLDRAASGALAFALSPEDASRACAAFERGQVDKRYLAVVRGAPPASGVIDHPIPRSPGGERADAVTEYRRLAQYGRYAVVEARPRTGRLHQIRRHMKHIACPLIGDVRYGKGEHNRLFRTRYQLHRLALHATVLALPHPRSGEWLAVTAPLADDLARALELVAADAAGG